MKEELNYKINVEPAMFSILYKIQSDVAGFGITKDMFTRALWVYGASLLDELETPPSWLMDEAQRRQQQAEASNIIDGEAGM